jgi:hypothetical protein
VLSAICEPQHNRCGPGQSRATKITRHVQKMKSRGKSGSIQLIKGHNNRPGDQRAVHLAGKAAEAIEAQLCGRGNLNEKSISWFKEQISKEFQLPQSLSFRATESRL